MTVHLQTTDPVRARGAVQLRTVAPLDLAWIEKAIYGPLVANRWRTRGATPSPDVLSRNLWDHVMAQYVIETGAPLGLIQLHDVDQRNATGYVSLLGNSVGAATPTQLRSGCDEFFLHAFELCGVRKLYAELLASSSSLFLERLPAGAVREGCLIDFEVTSSGFEDVEIWSWTREGADRDR